MFSPSDRHRVKVAKGGTIGIPATIRKSLGIRPGDEVLMRLEDGELRVWTRDHALRRAPKLVRRYVPKGELLSERLIAKRRAESESE